MKLYHSPRAINPERAVHFLRAKGKLDAVEIEEISIMKMEHKSAEYRALSPYAQVPLLILDDGTAITESRAICTYFEALFPEPNLMGNDPKEKALIEMWDRRIEMMFLIGLATWFRNSSEFMKELEKPQIPESAAKAEKSVRRVVASFDAHLADKDWVAADRFSIADITLYLMCGFSGVVGWKPHQEHDHLGTWHKRIAETFA
ncbi:MAG: glutathione S-transferase family protein [Pseudomonadota bacterium]